MLPPSGLAPAIGMRRSTVRLFAFFVLALLGAPVAMHVILHDLHDHHADHADAALMDRGDHGDHEHPVLGSHAPQVPNLTRAALPHLVTPATLPGTWTRITTAERNVVTFGALRTDTDVGLQPLLATFLI
jgi:hypothetical protein